MPLIESSRQTSTIHWQRVTEIFQAALDRPPEKRRSFIEEACGENQKLRQTVQALLDADREAGEFMESPLTHATFESLESPAPAPPSSAADRKED